MTPAGTQHQRAELIAQSMQKFVMEQPKPKLAFSLIHNQGPSGFYQSEELRKLPAGEIVWVHRTTSKIWEDQHCFISIDEETVIVHTLRERRLFLST